MHIIILVNHRVDATPLEWFHVLQPFLFNTAAARIGLHCVCAWYAAHASNMQVILPVVEPVRCHGSIQRTIENCVLSSCAFVEV